ncbi:hypothetical protein [Mycolicibacterium sp.]|uniref:hypothetical protein n=1 Tax=Mycolicibacterium sp. TaxID=2320850 RepID=UPI0037C74527
MTEKSTTELMMAAMRPALQSEISKMLKSLYYEDMTDDELAALAGVIRPAHARIQQGERPPSTVLKLVRP